MNSEVIRKIIQEQLRDILLEAPMGNSQFQARSKETGKIVDFKSADTLKAALKAGSHDPIKPQRPEEPQQQQAPQQGPESELDLLKSKVPEKTPEWLKDEKFKSANEIADRLGLLPTDQDGVWASMGEDDQPIAVVQFTEDPQSPLVPVADLPDELADQIAGKINDEMNDMDSEPQEPETKAEDDPPVNTKEMNKIRQAVYGKNKGVIAGFNKKKGYGRPDSKPPSDAVARQTATDTGFPKPPGTVVRSPITGEVAAPAPGNVGSQFNEILSVEGATIAIEFEKRMGKPATVSELEYLLDQQFGNTEMAKQNQVDPEVYKKKIRIVAEAAHRKNLRYKTALEENSPDFGPAESTHQFYGAEDSLRGQAGLIAEMPPEAKVFGPQGEITEINVSNRSRTELHEAVSALVKKEAKAGRVFDASIETSGGKSNPQVDDDAVAAYVDNIMSNPTDQENIRSFVTLMAMAGGGGANPSDTATFVKDKSGNVMVMWHSDKMERGDQQANSTLVKEASSQIETVEQLLESGVISKKQANAAMSILKDFTERVDALESGDNSPEISKTLLGLMKNKKRKKDILAAVDGLNNKYKKFIEGPPPGRSFDEFLKMITDPDHTATNDQKKVFAYLSKQLEGSETSFTQKELAVVNPLQLGAQARKDVVSSIQDKISKLDKIKSKNGSLGQLLEAHNIINKLHLYALNDPSDLAYQSGMCETIIGSSGVNADVLRNILGVSNTEELVSQIKVGPPQTKEGDYTDPDTGIPEAMLQRSKDSYETDKNGNTLMWVTDDKGNIVGKAAEGSKLKQGQQFKTLADGKTPVAVGVVTGQRSLLYIQTKDGKDFPISMQMIRSKSTSAGRLGTAYVYSKEFQDLIKQFEKTGLVAEIISNILNKRIIQENKTFTYKPTPLSSLSSIVEDIKENTPMELFLQEIKNGIYIDE